MTTFQIGERVIALCDIDCVHIGVCAEVLIFMKTGEAHRLQAENEQTQQETWSVIKEEFEKHTHIACVDTLYRPEAICSVAQLIQDGEFYAEVTLRTGQAVRRRYDDQLTLNEEMMQLMDALSDTQIMRSTAYVPPTLN